jgi:hypothetical protein
MSGATALEGCRVKYYDKGERELIGKMGEIYKKGVTLWRY